MASRAKRSEPSRAESSERSGVERSGVERSRAEPSRDDELISASPATRYEAGGQRRVSRAGAVCAVAARVPRARRRRMGSGRAQPAERSRFCGRAHGSGAALGRWSGAGGARRAGWGSARPRQAGERRGGQRARGTALRHGLTRFCTTCTVLEAAHGSRWLERAERAHRAQWWREQIRVLGISERSCN